MLDSAPAPDTFALAGCTLTPTALTDAEPDTDASAVNISALSSDGTKQTFISYGKYGKGQTFPDKTATKYDGS